MRYQVTHTTSYHYNAEVGRCYNMAHMLPRDTERQSCLRSSVQITPLPAQTDKHEDYFGNLSYYFSIQTSHTQLSITALSEVVMQPLSFSESFAFGLSCEEALQALRNSKEPQVLLAREFLLDSPMIKAHAALREYAAPSFVPGRPLLDAVRELTERIYREFAYVPGSTSVATPLLDVLKNRRGVCQDFAHLAIGCLRSLGFPARYISGYLETLPAPGQPKLIGADATHAWLAVFCPQDGWCEFDPTNNKMASQQHIVTAWGRDYSDVTPLRGVIFGGGKKNRLTVAVTVTRVADGSDTPS